MAVKRTTTTLKLNKRELALLNTATSLRLEAEEENLDDDEEGARERVKEWRKLVRKVERGLDRLLEAGA